MTGERIGGVVDLQLPVMLAIVKDAFSKYQNVEGCVKLVLAEAATSTIMNPFYLAYAKETTSLMGKGYSGGQLLNAANVILNKFVAHGLDMDILEKIRNTVLTLAPPAP